MVIPTFMFVEFVSESKEKLGRPVKKEIPIIIKEGSKALSGFKAYNTDSDYSRSAWISTWKKVALEHKFSEDVTDEIALIIQHYLDCIDPNNNNHPLSPQLKVNYEKSLHSFIKTQFPKSANSLPLYRDAGHWLAYCVAEAHRRCLQNKAFTNPNKPYKQFIKGLTEIIRLEYKRQMNASEYKQWSEEIEKSIEKFQQSSLDYIRRLQSDVLFPSFRGEPAENNAFLLMIKQFVYRPPPFGIPRYEEPTEMLVSKDKRFKSGLDFYFSRLAVNDSLSALFMQNLYSQLLDDKPYWFDIEWIAKSLDVTKSNDLILYWPAKVNLRFDPGDIVINKKTTKKKGNKR